MDKQSSIHNTTDEDLITQLGLMIRRGQIRTEDVIQMAIDVASTPNIDDAWWEELDRHIDQIMNSVCDLQNFLRHTLRPDRSLSEQEPNMITQIQLAREGGLQSDSEPNLKPGNDSVKTPNAHDAESMPQRSETDESSTSSNDFDSDKHDKIASSDQPRPNRQQRRHGKTVADSLFVGRNVVPVEEAAKYLDVSKNFTVRWCARRKEITKMTPRSKMSGYVFNKRSVKQFADFVSENRATIAHYCQ